MSPIAGHKNEYAAKPVSRAPITDVAKWLGLRNINVTYAIYGHLVPSSLERALEVLNAEYTERHAAA